MVVSGSTQGTFLKAHLGYGQAHTRTAAAAPAMRTVAGVHGYTWAFADSTLYCTLR